MTTSPVMTVTDELLAELEEAASNATAGPWSYDGSYVCTMRQDGETVYVESWNPVADALLSKNVKYISVANPSTITALTAELRRLRAENAELERVVKDVRWRVADTTDQLQAHGFNGDRLYGLDEWSVPIRNLNIAIGMLEKATQ